MLTSEWTSCSSYVCKGHIAKVPSDSSEPEVRVRGNLPVQELSRLVTKESKSIAHNDSATEWHLILGDGDVRCCSSVYNIVS
jgi:hypothetical protein